MAAEQAGVTLIEQPWFSTQRNLDSNVFHPPPTAKPYIPLIMKSLDLELINLVATQAKAQAAWTGEGGDHLFWQPHNSLPAADFVADRGVRFGLASAIDDARARLASEPYWFVLQSALEDPRDRGRGGIQNRRRLERRISSSPRHYPIAHWNMFRIVRGLPAAPIFRKASSFKYIPGRCPASPATDSRPRTRDRASSVAVAATH